MSDNEEHASDYDDREIVRLVKAARDQGEADFYTGKRSWVRYNAELPLDVRQTSPGGAALWPVVMHNASAGGIAFWSKRELGVGETVQIRLFDGESDSAWIDGVVHHTTCGIRGYLVGLSFEHATVRANEGDKTNEADQTKRTGKDDKAHNVEKANKTDTGTLVSHETKGGKGSPPAMPAKVEEVSKAARPDISTGMKRAIFRSIRDHSRKP